MLARHRTIFDCGLQHLLHRFLLGCGPRPAHNLGEDILPGIRQVVGLILQDEPVQNLLLFLLVLLLTLQVLEENDGQNVVLESSAADTIHPVHGLHA